MTKLNSLLSVGGNVSDFVISPDAARVVYRADQQTDEVSELYSVPIAGGPVTRLNGPLPVGGFIYSPAISPDSARVAYAGEQETDDQFELFVTFDESLLHPPVFIPLVRR